MESPQIARVEIGKLEATRPRPAGCNARLGAHGSRISLSLMRLTTDDGATGFGPSHFAPIDRLLGMPLKELATLETGITEAGRQLEFPLWDLLGQREERPVYTLLSALAGVPPPERLTVPCYDTSLYFDDLHLTDTAEAAEYIAREALEGYARGHRTFKIKIGRGARHLPLLEGTERDIAVIRAVRQAIGNAGPLLLDANNGYNFNLTGQVLAATADCGIYWIEEAFHEDALLYQELKRWLEAQGLPVLIADGEGQASPTLMQWAQAGYVDVVQYDIFDYGLQRWLTIGRQLDEWGARSAPHHYGAYFGNYAAPHLAAAIRGFTFAEWDEAACPAIDTSAYILNEGQVTVPALPGFGLSLDEEAFQRAVQEGGREVHR